MDASFDQFGGGGWGAGDNEQDSSLIRKTNVADKIFVPAEIEDLLVLPVDDDKYFLGSYSFNTVRVMGRIVNVHTDQKTYEICDAFASDPRIAKRLTIVPFKENVVSESSRFMGNVFSEGQIVHAIGKLYQFNNRTSVASFSVHEVMKEDIELYKMECKLAKIYFQQNLPEMGNEPKLVSTLFQNTATLVLQPRPGTGMSTGTPVLGRSAIQQPIGLSTTPNRPQNPLQTPIRQQNAIQTPNRPQPQAQNAIQTPNRQQPAMLINYTTQQRKILDYMKVHAENTIDHDGSGIHVNLIRMAAGASTANEDQFRSDLDMLQHEGKIYSTLDDNHFSFIEY